MKIGIDFDGVIFDDERKVRFAAEYWSETILGKPKLIQGEASHEKCFGWTDEEKNRFFTDIYDQCVEDCVLMPGVNEILKKLEEMGHEIYIITLRGCSNRGNEITFAKKIIKKLSIKPKQIIWGEWDKPARCKELGINLMIDDNPANVDMFNGTNIEVLYFKDSATRPIKTKNVTTVYTWMDVYHEILKRTK